MKKLTTRDLTEIALMSALTAVCSWITVPFIVPDIVKIILADTVAKRVEKIKTAE